MIKKTIIIGIIILMLVSSSSISALNPRIKGETTILPHIDNTIIENIYENSKTNNSQDFIYSMDKINFEIGWIKINSTGKGFHAIIPLRVFRINAPIPTIQYHNFFSFRIDLFITLVVYNDSKAITNITVNGERLDPITGNHSFLMGMLKIPSIGPLRSLLKNGVIDGIQAWQQLCVTYGVFKGYLSPAGILRWIRDKTIGKPVINLSDWKWRGEEVDEYLKALGGVPPRYQNYNIKILNGTRLNRWRDFFEENFPKMSEQIINKTLRYLVVLLPGYFWNRMPIRTSFLHLEMPQQLLGYTPFVIWGETSKLKKIVECLQFLPDDWFHDERIKFSI